MRHNGLGLVFVLAGACVVPAYVPVGTDTDTDVDVTDTDTDTVEDTDTVVDTPDTGIGPIDTTPTDEPGDLPALNCHPYDPVSYTAWERRYRVRFGSGPNGTEVHAPLGWGDVPSGVAGPVPSGWGYNVVVTGAGNSNNYNADYWSVCADRQNVPGGYDIGYKITAGGDTIKGGANLPNKYLPNEIDLYSAFSPSWQINTEYDLKIPVPPNPILPFCPSSVDGRRTIDARYTGIDFETINVTGLGNVEAYHLNLLLDQTQETFDSGALAQGCQLFNPAAIFSIFAGAFGFASDGSGGFITASIDRWYVRGVGLVKEEAIDYTTRQTLYTKTLTACSGLPECP